MFSEFTKLQVEIGHDVLDGREQDALGALGVVEVLEQLWDGHVGRGLWLTPDRLHVLDGVSADVVQQGDDDRLRVLSRGGLDVGPSELELEKHKGTETVKSTGGISNNQNSILREKIIKGIIKTMTNTLGDNSPKLQKAYSRQWQYYKEIIQLKYKKPNYKAWNFSFYNHIYINSFLIS